jgi:CTP synthase
VSQIKYLIFTGGVLSGLGKGVAAASIGKLIDSNRKILPIKMDGYLNYDPGTMNPIEHGEVFVLDDGGEVDMDFGHYERFLGITCKFEWNITMGKIFHSLLEKEREGKFLGKTVQLIPHATDEIKEKIYNLVKKETPDIVLIEVGGTIGDIENELFIEALRQLGNEVGRENILYVHLTYIPVPQHVNEPKTKPTQQSIKLLNQRGIWPDIIITRSKNYIDDKIKEKIALFCNVVKEDIINGSNVDNVYKIPLMFESQGIVERINKKLNADYKSDMENWKRLVDNINNINNKTIKVAICGKYTRLEDSYVSIMESLKHCSGNLNVNINLKWIETTDLKDIEEELRDVKGIIVPGGFGSRGTEGKINVIRYARENNIPFLGLCFGLQLAVIEYARNVCKLSSANSTEIDKDTETPIIDIIEGHQERLAKGKTMRLGKYKAVLKENSRVYELYNNKEVYERHRHHYEINPEYHKVLEDNGLILSGLSEDKVLVEFIEIPEHKFFIATQSHPELKSSLENPAPLFYGFVKACLY